VQLGQQALKQGEAISAVAQTTGFSDQAHFQRVFKQRVAATPDQYRRSVSEQD
jgi:AraC-like DNA-binding protein